jgi:hypothetical protein
MPISTPTRMLASAVPRVSWKCTATSPRGLGQHPGQHVAHLPGVGHADGVAQRDLVAAERPQRRHRSSLLRVDRPLVGAAVDGRDVGPHAQPASSAGGTSRGTASRVAAMVLFTFFLLWVSEADRKTAISFIPP